MFRKLVIGATALAVAAFLGYVLIGQIYPYVQWIANEQQIVRLSFESVEDFSREERIDPSVRAWVKLPETIPEDVKISMVEYEDDGLNPPKVSIFFERNGDPYMKYNIGGNHNLIYYKKLRSVELVQTEGELMVGRDNSVVIKWRDPDGPPYRYLYFYDLSLGESEMVAMAAEFSKLHVTT
jgi:hypothetical protein